MDIRPRDLGLIHGLTLGDYSGYNSGLPSGQGLCDCVVGDGLPAVVFRAQDVPAFEIASFG